MKVLDLKTGDIFTFKGKREKLIYLGYDTNNCRHTYSPLDNQNKIYCFSRTNRIVELVK